MEPIHAEFQYTEAEAIRATVAVTYSMKFYVRFLPWIGAVLIAFNGFYAISAKPRDIPLFPLFLGFLMLSIPFLTRWEAKRRFKVTPAAGNIISWNFSEDQLENSTTGAQSTFQWNRLILVRQLKDGFLLYPQPRIAHWIPKHAFKSEEDLNRFMQLVKNSGVHYKKGP